MSIVERSAVVDVFCGAGGLTHGFIKEGFNVTAGIDFDGSCKFPFEHNNHAVFLEADVMKLKSDEIKEYLKDADIKILIGCAPCQPFSTYNNSEDKKKDGKWRLLYRFAELIKEVSPDVFSMENVPTLKAFDKGKILADFKETMKNAGYNVTEFIVNCEEYGIPQHRKRLVVLGSKYSEIHLVPPTCKTPAEYKTVRDAIGSLPPLKAGEASQSDPLHRCARLEAKNLNRIKASKPGGTWRDWPDGIIAECHKKASGATFASVYGRMSWDEPSPTMTTLCFGYGNGRFGHPEQDRAISLREAALFQTFPMDYQFVKPGGRYVTKVLGRQIGNAVPVELGRIIAKSIAEHLKTKGR